MNKTSKRVKAYKYIKDGKEIIVSGYYKKPQKSKKQSSTERRTPQNSKKLREAKRNVPKRSRRQPLKQRVAKFLGIAVAVLLVGSFCLTYAYAHLYYERPVEAQVDEVAIAEVIETPKTNVDNSGGKSAVPSKSAVEIEYDEIVAKIHPNCAKYVPIVQKYDWDAKLAVAIMVAENNSCQADNENRSKLEDHRKWCGRYGSFGLWQLATCWSEEFGVSEKDMLNPETNIELAYKIYKRNGGSFHLWSAYKNGSYQKWLAVSK